MLLLCAMLAGCAQTGKTGEQENTGKTGETGQETGNADTGTSKGTETAGTAMSSTGSSAAQAAAAEGTAGESDSAFAADTAEPAAGEFSEPREEELTEQQKTEKMIREYIQTLSLEDKVSGLFIITPEALSGYEQVTEADGQVQESLKAYPLAGLIFFSQNIQSREQVQQMLALTKEWGSARLEGDNADPAAAEDPAADLSDAETAQRTGISVPPFLAVDEEGGICLSLIHI